MLNKLSVVYRFGSTGTYLVAKELIEDGNATPIIINVASSSQSASASVAPASPVVPIPNGPCCICPCQCTCHTTSKSKHSSWRDMQEVGPYADP
jgi:hypothetical protein